MPKRHTPVFPPTSPRVTQNEVLGAKVTLDMVGTTTLILAFPPSVPPTVPWTDPAGMKQGPMTWTSPRVVRTEVVQVRSTECGALCGAWLMTVTLLVTSLGSRRALGKQVGLFMRRFALWPYTARKTFRRQCMVLFLRRTRTLRYPLTPGNLPTQQLVTPTLLAQFTPLLTIITP